MSITKKVGTGLSALALAGSMAFAAPVAFGAEPQAQAATGKVSNWCMGTNHAVQVASGPSLTYNVHCNSNRTGHAVKSFYPMRVAQNGTNRCYNPGQWVQINAASVDVYTVRSC